MKNTIHPSRNLNALFTDITDACWDDYITDCVELGVDEATRLWAQEAMEQGFDFGPWGVEDVVWEAHRLTPEPEDDWTTYTAA